MQPKRGEAAGTESSEPAWDIDKLGVIIPNLLYLFKNSYLLKKLNAFLNEFAAEITKHKLLTILDDCLVF